MIFFVYFFILMIVALLICQLLFPIIIYCVCTMFFLTFCVLSSWLSLSVTLYIYIHISLWWGKKTNSWTVVGSSSLDQKTLSLLFFFLLSVKYLTYLTGFHCPVDSLSSHNPNVVCPRLNAEHSSIIGWSYNGDEFRLWSILCDCPSTFSKWLP